ncbi:DUF6417 family protein [Streptomyces sp. NPDC001857]|uniref:DUF6417 family protein n=1 Tax=unclassified Streptomyces TaxID=2593676 RepID=UPI00332BADFB
MVRGTGNRHVLYLSHEQTASVAYAFWLHRTCSAFEANRFARDYGTAYHPRLSTEPSVCRPAAGA